MDHWLYRYVFKGVGVLFLLGMITLLYLMINSGIYSRQSSEPTTEQKGEPR